MSAPGLFAVILVADLSASCDKAGCEEPTRFVVRLGLINGQGAEAGTRDLTLCPGHVSDLLRSAKFTK